LNAVITTMRLQEDGPVADPVCPHPSCVRMYEKKWICIIVIKIRSGN
jgi:hypothetical protein